jgi:hypothetical protein
MSVTIKATYKLTGWNATQLRLRIPAILTAYGTVIDRQFKEDIKQAQFPWPRATKRKNQTTVTSPRDIVDLGGFLRSQRRDRPSATQLRFIWSAPYAPLILNGYTTNRGSVVPGRNWIKPALEAVPLDQFFADQWKALARRKL